jgi:cytochrome c peroxidase
VGHGVAAGTVSVYRRPPSAAQMNFKTLRADGQGPPLQGSLMWDGRQPTLEAQAIEASQTHLQAAHSPDQTILAKLVALQTGAFTAQLSDSAAGPLDAQGALGGPAGLQAQIPLPAGGTTFAEFAAWAGRPGRPGSIARGEALFNGREFAVRNVDGFNERPGVGNPAQGVTCSTCHNIGASGADFFADPQRNIGIGGTGVKAGGPTPASDLPRFTLTCRKGSRPGFLGLGPVVTNDPGRALITGRCADIGRFTVPQLRALAAREPYFHDGSAKSLEEVMDFYERRFDLGLSAAERQDLINFLAAL